MKIPLFMKTYIFVQNKKLVVFLLPILELVIHSFVWFNVLFLQFWAVLY